jgi:glutamate synthase (ferredoxin)
VQEAIEKHLTIKKKFFIENTDRSSFSKLSGFLAFKYGDDGFDGNLNFELTGLCVISFLYF